MKIKYVISIICFICLSASISGYSQETERMLLDDKIDLFKDIISMTLVYRQFGEEDKTIKITNPVAIKAFTDSIKLVPKAPSRSMPKSEIIFETVKNPFKVYISDHHFIIDDNGKNYYEVPEGFYELFQSYFWE